MTQILKEIQNAFRTANIISIMEYEQLWSILKQMRRTADDGDSVHVTMREIATLKDNITDSANIMSAAHQKFSGHGDFLATYDDLDQFADAFVKLQAALYAWISITGFDALAGADVWTVFRETRSIVEWFEGLIPADVRALDRDGNILRGTHYLRREHIFIYITEETYNDITRKIRS
jgi:hypothetical protein